jgi:hypothetical protein
MPILETAALIAGAVHLGKVVLDKAAGKIGEAGAKAALEYWPKVKALLGLAAPAPDKLDAEIGKAVDNKPEIHAALQLLLEEHDKAPGAAPVVSIQMRDGQSIVAHEISGSVTTNLTFGKS